MVVFAEKHLARLLCLLYGWDMAQSAPSQRAKYRNQRARAAVPVVTLATARKMADKTLQDVCDHINREFQFPKTIERGTISAIENGHRGASIEMLVAIASALGIPADAIDTQYEPRHSRNSEAVA